MSKKGIVKSEKGYGLAKGVLVWEKIRDFFDYHGQTIIMVVIGGIVAALLLGGLHHFAYMIHRDVENERTKGRIEHVLSENEMITSVSVDEFAVSEKDGKKYVNIYGTFMKVGANKPYYGVATYEISEELYAKINRYIRTTFEYNSFGEPVNAEVEPRDEKPLDGARARRVYYKSLKEIEEIVRGQEFVNIEFFNGGASLLDVEAE